MKNTVIVGNAMDMGGRIPDGSIDCCVTSPPYWGLRDYGTADQLGLEKTPDEYVANMVKVFREVWRVLKPGGTLWLNLGDSYARDPGKGGSGTPNGRNNRGENYNGQKALGGLLPKSLVGIPWRVAFALQADGWILRSDIIWHKPNPMPESVRDRPTKSHEYLFMFAKQQRYYFDQDAVREDSLPYAVPGVDARNDVTDRTSLGPYAKQPILKKGRAARAAVYNPLGRNIRDVWTIATQPFKGAHFAVMPPKLVEPCIKAGCPEGGTVLDPFCGAGTVGLVASRLRREFIGVEINPDFAQMARDRINADAPLFNDCNDFIGGLLDG